MGEASVRRVYGDFSSPQMTGWSKVKAEFGLVPHHQPANTVGKNASDIALVIDAMDLMHSGRFDGFVVISSDSDFTRLASRIREQGLDVYGIGQKKTPEAFRKACKRFIFLENLGGAPAEPARSVRTDDRTQPRPANPPQSASPSALQSAPQLATQPGSQPASQFAPLSEARDLIYRAMDAIDQFLSASS
jgi:hypothetical protein